MKDIGAGLEAAGKVESAKEIHDAAAALRTLQEQVAPRVRELREMDDWRRFANAQRQEQLIAMAEAIVLSLKAEAEQGKESDLSATARALKELHAKWPEVAEAPRNSAQRLWDRFRAATDFIRARCEPYFQKLRQERTAPTSRRRRRIVAEAESLAASTDWVKTTVRFQELQKAWTGIGPRAERRGPRSRAALPRGIRPVLRAPPRRSRDAQEGLVRKPGEEGSAVRARRSCWPNPPSGTRPSSEMKRLQNDWKTVGPIRRNKSEEMWNRFRAAADKFFERYHNRHQIALASKLAEREAMVVELETMAATEASDAAGRLRREDPAAAHDVEPQRADSVERSQGAGRSVAGGAHAARAAPRRRVRGHGSRSGRRASASGKTRRQGGSASSRTSAKRRRDSPPPKRWRPSSGRRSRATPWAAARATKASGAPQSRREGRAGRRGIG